MDNLLGIDFETDMREIINDLPNEIIYLDQRVNVTSSMITLEVQTMDGGSKLVPGVDFVAVISDFLAFPDAGKTLEHDGRTLRIITVEKFLDNKCVRLRCAYKDN